MSPPRPRGPRRARPARSLAPGPVAVGYEETGEASWYGNPYHGRRAASGEVYDMNQMTAAHRTLPFGTRIRVQSLVDGSAVEVRINDRGPFKDEDKRILDLSFAAGKLLGAIGPGVIPIRLRVVSLAEPAGGGGARPRRHRRPRRPPPWRRRRRLAPPAVSAPPPAPAVVSAQAPVAPPAPGGAAPILARAAGAARAQAAARTEPAPASRACAASRAARRAATPPGVRRAARRRLERAARRLCLRGAGAVTLRDSLARAWPDARVQRAEVGGRPLWRVRVGNYASRREADEAVKRLAASGYRAMVVDAAP